MLDGEQMTISAPKPNKKHYKIKDLMAEMANVAGGLVCEEVGTVAINKEKFLKECNALLN